MRRGRGSISERLNGIRRTTAQQIWQIGMPNRSAKEFLKGDDHWHWGMYIEYARLFPNDVDFTVGKSDPAKDWFIYQVPHDTDFKPDGRDQGRATPWTIHFEMPAGQPACRKGYVAVWAGWGFDADAWDYGQW